MAYKIIIADDHDVIREGIKNILRKQPDYDVVAEAGNGEEALQLVEKFKPDVLLLDISMPKKSGLDILKQISYASPGTKVIIVSVHRAPIYTTKAFKSKVKGYIHKENVVGELLPALRNVLRGDVYVSQELSKYLVEQVSEKDKPQGKIALTERESDILRLVVEGKTAKEIAEILFISRRTVENYKNNILRKLKLHKTSDLIKYAIQNKVIEP